MESPNINIQFKLESINEIVYRQSQDNALLDNLSPETIGVQFMTQTFINKSKNEVRVQAGVRYSSRVNNTEILVLEIMLLFNVDNIDNIVNIIDKKINYNTNIVLTFLNISIGTLRGVLFAKTQDSVLSKFHLPLISSQLLLSKNTFILDKK